jgi:hypothetical protein
MAFSMIRQIKFFGASFKLYPLAVTLILIWSLSSNNFIFSAKALQEHPPTMTTANSTSFKAIATNSSATPFTNMHVHKLTSASSKSGATPFTNMHVHKLTSFSFNVLATTFVTKLPQTLLPSYTVTNVSDTRSEGILSANNSLNNKGTYVQHSLSKTIHGTTYSPYYITPTTGNEKER